MKLPPCHNAPVEANFLPVTQAEYYYISMQTRRADSTARTNQLHHFAITAPSFAQYILIVQA